MEFYILNTRDEVVRYGENEYFYSFSLHKKGEKKKNENVKK